MKRMHKKIKIGIVNFPEIKISAGEIHKIRGFFGNIYKDFDLVHNHDTKTGKPVYRYPAVQFKRDQNGSPAIYAFKQEGIEILKDIFLSAENIRLEKKDIRVHGKEINTKESRYGEDDEVYAYRFLSPWIALNPKNYKDYLSLSNTEAKILKLHSILVNNIISFCKFTGYTVENRLKIKSKFKETKINLKSQSHVAFIGEFMVNFLLPDFIGIGKSSSRGFGCIERIL